MYGQQPERSPRFARWLLEQQPAQPARSEPQQEHAIEPQQQQRFSSRESTRYRTTRLKPLNVNSLFKQFTAWNRVSMSCFPGWERIFGRIAGASDAARSRVTPGAWSRIAVFSLFMLAGANAIALDYEQEIVDFHGRHFDSIPIRATYDFPAQPEHKEAFFLATASLVFAVGSDIALVVSVGGSEAVVQVTTVAKAANYAKRAADVGLVVYDASQGMQNNQPGLEVATDAAWGLKNEAVELLELGTGSLPLARTAFALVDVFRVGQDRKEFTRELIRQNQQTFTALIVNSDAEELRKRLENDQSLTVEQRNEYQRVLDGLVTSYVLYTAYKDAVWRANRPVLKLLYQEIDHVRMENLPDTNSTFQTAEFLLEESSRSWLPALKIFAHGDKKYQDLRPVVLESFSSSSPFSTLGAKIGMIFDSYQDEFLDFRVQLQKYPPQLRSKPSYASICSLAGGLAVLPPYVIPDLNKAQGTQVPAGAVGTWASTSYQPCASTNGTQPPNPSNSVVTRNVIAVVDSSGSMSSTDPRNLRTRALSMMLDVLSEQTRLGIIDFDDSAKTILNPSILGSHTSTTRRTGHSAVQNVDSSGGTDIPAALQSAAAMINGAGLTNVAIVLLTDGDSDNWDGTAPSLPPGTVVHTLAFSDQANREKLAKVSAETGGIAEIARTANDLPDIISRLFEGAEAREVLLLERGRIQAGQTLWYDLVVDPGLLQLLTDVFWPGSDLDLELTSPSGQRHTTASAKSAGRGVETDYYDLISVPQPESGKWRLGVKGVQVDGGGESFTVRASSSGNPSPVNWQFSVPVPEVGAPFSVGVDSSGRVTWRDADIWLTDPDGNRVQLPFSGGGLGSILSGSSAASILNFVPKQAGYHRLRIVLQGVTRQKEPVIRVLERAVNVAPPGKGRRWKIEVDPFIERR